MPGAAPCPLPPGRALTHGQTPCSVCTRPSIRGRCPKRPASSGLPTMPGRPLRGEESRASRPQPGDAARTRVCLCVCVQICVCLRVGGCLWVWVYVCVCVWGRGCLCVSVRVSGGDQSRSRDAQAQEGSGHPASPAREHTGSSGVLPAPVTTPPLQAAAVPAEPGAAGCSRGGEGGWGPCRRPGRRASHLLTESAVEQQSKSPSEFLSGAYPASPRARCSAGEVGLSAGGRGGGLRGCRAGEGRDPARQAGEHPAALRADLCQSVAQQRTLGIS